MEQQKRRLVLNFDLNMTILMRDDAQGYTLDYSLSKILAGQCWGTLEDKDDRKIWKIAHNTVSFLRPQPEFISYAEFAKLMHGEDEETMRRLISEFTLPGKPGYKFKTAIDKMHRCLSFPKSIYEDYGLFSEEDQESKESEDEEEKSLIRKLFAGGKALIVPSFFRMIQELKKTKREFSVIFRSFGNDLPVAIEEFNMFCRGNHPAFNGKHGTPRLKFDGTNKTKDMLVDSHNIGYFLRKSEEDQALHLGTLNRGEEGNVVYKDFHSMYVAILESLVSSASMAISDDYFYWTNNGESGPFGKLHLVDRSDYSTHCIFFDDKISVDNSAIIDIRDVVSGQSIAHEEAINNYYFRVDPYRAITEADYFYKSLLACEENRNLEISRVENGVEEETNEEEQAQTEWEKLQKLPTQEYLAKTIIPILIPGMKIVDTLRPDDPVNYLALYILKNQSLVKLPSVSYSPQE